MEKKYTEHKDFQLSEMYKDILEYWKKNQIFEKSISSRPENNPYIFYEGPPSANGMPGIHHVMARTIKDIFCRYKTQKGFQVKRKAGWDTHGLPIELSVEKELGITKEDIGKKISIEEYNQKCREAVMKYTEHWNKLTEMVGYWVDMENPYITYENKYIETVWWLLKDLYTKNLLYQGYTIQPYSPAAGTGLSSHELNQPGCYKNIKDTSVVAQFLLHETEQKVGLLGNEKTYILAWTTTPWTLPSNTALTVGEKIEYVLVETYNPYTFNPIQVILAKDLLSKYFAADQLSDDISSYKSGDKKIPYKIRSTFKGKDMLGLTYHPLLPYCKPAENPEMAFRVIAGDFVTTEDGTGIVHTAPTFGADDARVAKQAGVPAMLVKDSEGNLVPLVNAQGKFIDQMGDLAGKYVKIEYYEKGSEPEKSVDVEIAIKLKEMGLAFKVEKYEHNYPHCWRTDKPVLYYPLNSWFIKTTSVKERLIELNKTIGWKPESTGTGRFGNWLENLQDWNLSRSRYWGIPIPIWTSEDKTEQICIGSIQELKEACEKSVQAGVMKQNPLEQFEPNLFSEENYQVFDLHRPYVDDIILVSDSGKKLYRESDLIDVWFDSGAMPYAQIHYPFENKDLIDQNKYFPADFIAEGVDQTRGWFFTLHAISCMCFNSVAYKNVVSNGLVLDKNGQKMSKRLGNAIDPFETITKYGPDATRFYMITNAQPWDNLKFDVEGISEVQRKFFRALHNTYSFFALYANVDGFYNQETLIPIQERPEIDRWIISRLHSLIQLVDESYAQYEPTKAGRAIQDFVVDELSNWYVRQSRKRFWRGEYSQDKISAYQTLFECLDSISKLVAPIAPFYAEQLYLNIYANSPQKKTESVHLDYFPEANKNNIDEDLEQRMLLAQKVSSMILAIRKKEKIKVRQPLQKIIIPSLNLVFKKRLLHVQDIILAEVNVKELQILDDQNQEMFVKKAKADFKKLGPKYGKLMKEIAIKVSELNQSEIQQLESVGQISIVLNGENILLYKEDIEILTQDIPGWQVASEDGITVALDISVNETLLHEGLARELINRIQNFRKEIGLEVTDKIHIKLQSMDMLNNAIKNNLDYICSETLTSTLEIVENIDSNNVMEVEIDDEVKTKIAITKN